MVLSVSLLGHQAGCFYPFLPESPSLYASYNSRMSGVVGELGFPFHLRLHPSALVIREDSSKKDCGLLASFPPHLLIPEPSS